MPPLELSLIAVYLNSKTISECLSASDILYHNANTNLNMKTIKKTLLVLLTLAVLSGIGYMGFLGYEELEWNAYQKYKQGKIDFVLWQPSHFAVIQAEEDYRLMKLKIEKTNAELEPMFREIHKLQDALSK